ncbi:MAG TPA: peptide ABC transporter substrate-binding protein [Dehalococcoidia bacterium]|nr:peptide ABC transporter substrate-binding protein [Dehalococcoidia bacterium]
MRIRSIRRLLPVLTSLSLLMVFLVACTGTQVPQAKPAGGTTDSSGATKSATSGESTGSGQTPQAKSGQPADASGSAPQGVLRQLHDDPPTLDPHLAQDATSAEYILEIFSGLVALDKSLQVIPDLAESWEVGEGGTVYTFKLRQNATFHDGKPVTAKDVKFSFERAADPATGSLVADTYLGDIVGVNEKLQKQAQEVRGVEVLDDYTVRITIDAPKAYFLAKLTYPTAFVVDEANVKQGRRWTDKPNGTGPFKLKEWRRGDRIVLTANTNFYRGPVTLGELHFLLAGGSAMTMYENGEIDIGGANVNEIDRVRADPTLSKELRELNNFTLSYIGFNVNLPPFDDPKVRQAFTHAVDKERVSEVILKNLVAPAYGILPPGFPGYNDNLQGLRYDPERAKQLLAESKYAGNLPPVTLAVSGQGSSPGRYLEAIIEMWRQNLGVEVNYQLTEYATFLDELKARKYQMFTIGWVADYPDPQNFLDIKLHSKSSDNESGYSNPQYDALIERARTEQNLEERIRLYQQAEQIVVNDAPWLPLNFGKSYPLVKPYVKNFDPAPIVIPQYKDVVIEK